MSATLTPSLLLTAALAPLAGALVAGLAGHVVGRRGAHTVTILGVLVSFVCSVIARRAFAIGRERFDATI